MTDQRQPASVVPVPSVAPASRCAIPLEAARPCFRGRHSHSRTQSLRGLAQRFGSLGDNRSEQPTNAQPAVGLGRWGLRCTTI